MYSHICLIPQGTTPQSISVRPHLSVKQWHTCEAVSLSFRINNCMAVTTHNLVGLWLHYTGDFTEIQIIRTLKARFFSSCPRYRGSSMSSTSWSSKYPPAWTLPHMERVLACPCQIENENHKAGFIPQLSSPSKVYLFRSIAKTWMWMWLLLKVQ